MGLATLRALLAIAAGALGTFAFAPFGLWWLAPLSLALWMWMTIRRPAFSTGYWFGFGLFATGVSWVSVSMVEHGGASLGLAGIMTGLFAAVLAIFPGLASWGYAAWHQRWPSTLRKCLLLSACWVTMEALRSWALTGFPWLLMGYSAMDSPFEGYLSWIGTFGASAMMALCAAALVVLVTDRQWQTILIPTAVLFIGFTAQALFQPKLLDQSVRVALWQPLIVQSEKWKPEYLDSIVANHVRRGLPSDADVIVWPETALPMTDQQARRILPDLDALLIRDEQTLIAGVLGQDDGRYTNRLMTFGQGAGTYDKTRLVPFGEYVPLESWLRGLIAFFDLPMSSIVPGTAQDLLRHDTLIMAPLICYEIAYTGLARAATKHANAILTVSNDTWFGDSIGPDQHLEIARIRARELGKPVIRATNDGWTAVIDAQGNLKELMPRFESGLLFADVRPAVTRTPYAEAGEAPLILILVILLTLSRKNEALLPE
jgi:apolipoprotein N-acyltransferase